MRNMEISAFLKELRNLMQEVSEQLMRRQAGNPGTGTVDELRFILKELSEIEKRAASGKLPPSGDRWLASTRIVTDTWPHDSQLGERICAVADLYQRKVE
jgi:hypothetical protein